MANFYVYCFKCSVPHLELTPNIPESLVYRTTSLEIEICWITEISGLETTLSPKKNTSHGNEVLSQDTTHLIQIPCYQQESPCQDPAHEDLLTIVQRRKLQWYGHVSLSSSLAKAILQGTVKGRRRQGRQKKRWEGNIKEWTGLEFAKSQRAV